MSTDLETRLRATFERHLGGEEPDVVALLGPVRARVARRRLRVRVAAGLVTAAVVAAGAATAAGLAGEDAADRFGATGPPLAGSAPSAPSAAPGAQTLALAGHWYLDTPAPEGTSAGPPVGGLLVGTQSSAADGPDLRMSWMTTRCRLGGSLRLTPSADGAGSFVVGAPSPDPAAAGGCTPDPAEVVVRDALAAARGLRLADDRLVVLGRTGRFARPSATPRRPGLR